MVPTLGTSGSAVLVVWSDWSDLVCVCTHWGVTTDMPLAGWLAGWLTGLQLYSGLATQGDPGGGPNFVFSVTRPTPRIVG